MLNPNYTHTVTIYNRHKSADGYERWQRTVVPNVFYRELFDVEQSRAIQTQTQRSYGGSYLVRISKQSRFMDSSVWNCMLNRGNFFTLKTDDIVVYGECTEEITGMSPDTAAELLNRHKPHAFRIKAIQDNTGHIFDKHFKVVG